MPASQPGSASYSSSCTWAACASLVTSVSTSGVTEYSAYTCSTCRVIASACWTPLRYCGLHDKKRETTSRLSE